MTAPKDEQAEAFTLDDIIKEFGSAAQDPAELNTAAASQPTDEAAVDSISPAQPESAEPAEPAEPVEEPSPADYGWFSIPLPLQYGLEFNPTVILSVLVLYLVAISEFIGISSTTAFVSVGRDATEAEIRSGMICDGCGSAFSSLFNALPNTSYCNSLGVIAVTGVASRYVIAIAGAMLVVISFFPKISAVINLIPYPVLGAVMLVIIGGVVTAGIETLLSVKFTQRNLAIIGVTLAVGVGFGLNASALSGLPFLLQTLLSGIPGAAIVGLVLNLVCPRRPEDKVTDESTVTT